MTGRWIRAVDGVGTPAAVMIVFVLLVVIALLDAATGPQASFSIFYLLPVVMATLAIDRPAGVVTALVGAALWIVVERATQRFYSSNWLLAWNGTVRLGFFIGAALVMGALAASRRHEAAAARHDPVSRLLNRVGFIEAAHRELERARRGGSPLVFVFIDLDDFKMLNDAHGHRAGDIVLRFVGDSCRRSLRAIDIAGRVGGDEFALCLPDTDLAGAGAALDRLRRDTVGAPFGALGLSMGVVEFAVPPASVEEALERADAVMYEAKVMVGKNHTQLRRLEAAPG